MSIYVAIEVLKWFQVRLISEDRDMARDLNTATGVGLSLSSAVDESSS